MHKPSLKSQTEAEDFKAKQKWATLALLNIS